MKDVNGKTLHVDELVTFTKEARPRRLIGYHARVARLGDVRVLLAPTYEVKRSITENIRVEPRMVVAGIRQILDPMVDNPQFKEMMAVVFDDFLDRTLAQAILEDIIDGDTAYAIIKIAKTRTFFE